MFSHKHQSQLYITQDITAVEAHIFISSERLTSCDDSYTVLAVALILHQFVFDITVVVTIFLKFPVTFMIDTGIF